MLRHKINLLFLGLLLIGCQSNDQPVVEVNQTQVKQELEQGLILMNSTLEQSNAKGKTLWRLKTEKATYSPDKKTAKLENLTANLFDDEVLILQVSADRGELRNDGKEIYLQDNIIAVDPRNKAEFRGEKVTWKPEENMMQMTAGKDGVKAFHATLNVRADKAQYNTASQVLELNKNIIATTSDPSLQLKTEHLYWQIQKDKVIGNKPLNVVRYENKTVTDRLKTDQAEVDLKSKIAIISGNIQYQSYDPLLQATTNKIIWYYPQRIMKANETTKLIQPDEGTSISANTAQFNLETNQVNLQGGIYGTTVENDAKIYADNMNWNLNNQEIDADGNVFYQQVDPDMNLRGTSAKGNLQDKNIVVLGDAKTKVTSTIFAEE